MADPLDDAPLRLVRFVADEWTAGDPADPAGAWGREAKAWLAAHPGRSLPLAADAAGVDEWVAALRASLARRAAWQHLYYQEAG
jgi:hypothetical protein